MQIKKEGRSLFPLLIVNLRHDFVVYERQAHDRGAHKVNASGPYI
jgi:hypothetical protein